MRRSILTLACALMTIGALPAAAVEVCTLPGQIPCDFSKTADQNGYDGDIDGSGGPLIPDNGTGGIKTADQNGYDGDIDGSGGPSIPDNGTGGVKTADQNGYDGDIGDEEAQ